METSIALQVSTVYFQFFIPVLTLVWAIMFTKRVVFD